MKNNFLFKGLKKDQFLYLDRLTQKELQRKHIKKLIVDEESGFPCRVSMKEGKIGETFYLLSFQHLNNHSPYDASGPIYVTLDNEEATLEVNEIPPIVFNRAISLHCYDINSMMIEGHIFEPRTLTSRIIGDILNNEDIFFIDAHNAARGCYSSRIYRV